MNPKKVTQLSEELHRALAQLGSGLLAPIGNEQSEETTATAAIRVYDAVWIVANTIAGTPQEKIDKLIENRRKNAASN